MKSTFSCKLTSNFNQKVNENIKKNIFNDLFFLNLYCVCLHFSVRKDMRLVCIPTNIIYKISCVYKSMPWKKDTRFQNPKFKLCVLNFLFTRIWDLSVPTNNIYKISCVCKSMPWKKDTRFQNAKLKLCVLNFLFARKSEVKQKVKKWCGKNIVS